jgi:hypothetical protein
LCIEFNEQQPTLKFALEKELHDSINFLGLSRQHREKELEFAMYRKYSCHPHEYKISDMATISKEATEKEPNIIKTHYVTIIII